MGDQADDQVVVRVPTLSLEEFSKKYALGDSVRKLLENQGFETAGALLEISDSDLESVDFKKGHIAELKRALRDFLLENCVAENGV